MSAASDVSVVIPTCRRPALLHQALQSIWRQTCLPREIVIGDDSDDDETEGLVRDQWSGESPVPLRYHHHRPGLREALNVDALFRAASGETVLLLHDDDLLEPDAICVLGQALVAHPEAVAAFGLQILIHADGAPFRNPDGHNPHFLRTPDRAGVVDGLIAGATRMFPNNGWLVRRDAATEVGYDDHGRAGRAIDFYFGLRLGRLGRPMVFVPTRVSAVRVLSGSASRALTSDNAYHMVQILEQDHPDLLGREEVGRAVGLSLPSAIATACARGDRAAVRRWLWSPLFAGRWRSLQWWRAFVRSVAA